MLHTVTQHQRGDARLINFITMGDDFLHQRQIEKRSGKVFMRLKKRAV